MARRDARGTSGDCVETRGRRWCKDQGNMLSSQGLAVWLVLLVGIFHRSDAQINAACLNRLDLVVVFDSSGSVPFNFIGNWGTAKAFTKLYLNSFHIGRNQVHVAIMQVAENSNMVMRFSGNREEVYRTIDGLRFLGGKTNLASAFRMGMQVFTPQEGARDNIQRVFLLMTDGQPTVEISNTIPSATTLKTDRNVVIVPVAISGHINRYLLRQVSSSPDMPIVTFDHIYITQNFLQSQSLDLCILMDSSGSILFLDINNWYYGKLFLEYLALSLRTSTGRNRFAAITFNETAKIHFNLGQFSNNNDVIRAIRQMEYSGGRTNIAAALKLARDRVFDMRAPITQGHKRVIVLITDGVPTDSPGTVETTAIELKQAGIEIVSVVVAGRHQVNRDRLRRLASIISSGGANFKPAVIEVTDYRSLGSQVNTVVDRVCSVPIGRGPDTDLVVTCYRDCHDQTGRLLLTGNYHYCPFGRMYNERDCINYIYCDPRGDMMMVGCPAGTSFDDSLKACTWKTCSCPGDKRTCFRPPV